MFSNSARNYGLSPGGLILDRENYLSCCEIAKRKVRPPRGMSEDGSISSDIPCRYLTGKGKPDGKPNGARIAHYPDHCTEHVTEVAIHALDVAIHALDQHITDCDSCELPRSEAEHVAEVATHALDVAIHALERWLMAHQS